MKILKGLKWKGVDHINHIQPKTLKELANDIFIQKGKI